MAERTNFRTILKDAMKDQLKYDPEDIESLLLHKQYNELFEDEREFVLQYIGSEEEYESLRKTLFELHDAPEREEWLEPDPSIKTALLAEFASEEQSGFKVWLNNLFAGINLDWLRRPAFALPFATACIAVVLVVFINRNKEAQMAANKDTLETVNQSAESEDSTIESSRLFAENLSSNVLPPAPAEALVSALQEVKTVVMTDEVTNEEIAESPAPAASDSNYSEDLSEANLSDDFESETDKVVSTAEGKESVMLKQVEVKDQSDIPPTSTSTKIATNNAQIRSLSNAESMSAVSIEQRNLFSETVVGTAGAQLHLSDPAVATASQVRDVFDLLFTAK